MGGQGWLTERFEENRPRLRDVAYRILGSLSEADDAVQEAWLRVSPAFRNYGDVFFTQPSAVRRGASG